MDYQRMMMEEQDKLVQKWTPFLEGIDDDYTRGTTAILLENEARYLTEAPGATGAADVQGLQKIMLPIVRRVFPNLIANNIVSVQPLAAPAGIIFYLKYEFGTNRPGTAVGDEFSMFEGVAGEVAGYNPYYSSDEIGPFKGDSTGTTALTIDTSAMATDWPATGQVLGTISVKDADGVVTEVYSFAGSGDAYNTTTKTGVIVRPANRLEISDAFGVDATDVAIGGDVVITPKAGSTADFDAEVFYKTDLEFTQNIPEMRINIDNIPVNVKSRKLKAMWSQESEQDLKAYHGLSADAELTALVSNEMIAEIDREIIQKCLSIVPATSRFQYDWNAFASNNTSGNYLDAHLALMQRVTRASNEIFRKSKIGPANWMVIGTKVASYVEVLKGFIPNPVTASMGMNIVKAGTYAGKFDIYKDPMFPENKILMGHKSPQTPFGAGIVYSPYVTNLTPVIVGENDFNPRRGFLARYGLTQVPHGQLLYGAIDIKDLP